MADDSSWYLGPLESMRQVPGPIAGLDASQVGPGVHTSITGRTAVDRFAAVRVWQMGFRAMSEDDGAYLAAVGQGVVRGPLRLVDPLVRNRLSPNLASVGAIRRSLDGFGTAGAAGTLTRVAITDPPPACPVQTVIAGTSSGNFYITVGKDRASTRVPLIGPSMTVAFWARGTQQVQASGDLWKGDGTNTAGFGPTVTLTSAWQRVAWTIGTPATGVVAVTPFLYVGGSTAGTVQIAGISVAASTEPAVWTPGGGAPSVVAVTHGRTYPTWQRTAQSITLQESI